MSSGRRYPLISRRSSSGATEARILDVVDELVETAAFHRATVDDIAAQAGVAKATVYQHFGSKLGLIEALGARLEQDAGLGRVFRAMALPNPADALLATAREGVRFWCSHEALFTQLMALATVDPHALEFVGHENRQQQEHLRQLAARLESDGKLRKGISADDAYAAILVANSFDTTKTLRARGGLSVEDAIRAVENQLRPLLANPRHPTPPELGDTPAQPQ